MKPSWATRVWRRGLVAAMAVAPGIGVLTGPTAVQAQSSAATIRDAIEGRQDGPGPDGLGELTLSELMNRFGVPGLSIAVVRDFELGWAKGYGIADVETGQRVHVETRFQAASISKPVAAMGVMKAVEDGLFGLDDDINDVLRSWRLDGSGFTEARPVTPRTLTSHTSGLGDGFGFPGYDPGAPLPTIVQILEGHPSSNVGPIFMEREPMTFYEYSGGGVTLMQLALTDARGGEFVDVMRDLVLEPIGMTSSSYEQPMPESARAASARGHGDQGQAMGHRWHVYPELAAAGLWTTPTDLALFVIEVQRAARGDAGRVISQASAREMLDPVGVGPFAVGFTIERRGEGWYFSHGGSNWGFRALILGHKTKGYGLAIMTNGDQGTPVMNEVSRRIQNAYGWDSVANPVQRGSRR